VEGRLAGFVIWAIMGALFIAMGINVFISRKPKPFGFWANVKTTAIENVKGYNCALGILWCVYGVLFVLLGLPLLVEGNPGLMIVSMVGVVFISIGAMAVYEAAIVPRYRKK